MATVTYAGLGTPTGTISFYDGVSLIGAAQPLVAGVASLTTAELAAGAHNVAAVYSGDANFIGNSSAMLVQHVIDFTITLAAGGTAGGGGSGNGSQTAAPGQAVSYGFTIQPLGGVFPFPITLSATGLPPGATVTFTPQIITLGVTPSSFTMIINTPASTAGVSRKGLYGPGAGFTLAVGLLLWPLSRRRQVKFRRPLMLGVALISSLAALGVVMGCGTGSGFFGQTQRNYAIEVLGTVSGDTTLQHFATVTLALE
jgi:hypothetical protein